MSDDFAWMETGNGVAPRKRWAFATDAPLVGLELARETGEVLAADSSGGLYLFDRRGRLASITRGFHAVSSVAWCDTGTGGAAAVGENRLSRFDRQLQVDWSLDLPEPILAVATDPCGNCIAASLADGRTLIYDAHRRKLGAFESQRPLCHLRLLAMEPALIVAADYGLVACREFLGHERWNERTTANVGDIAATGDGGRVYVAGFSHGIRILDELGRGRGSWILEGTANRVSCSFTSNRVAATTLERHLYWLDDEGDLLWGTVLPDDPVFVRVDPLGTGMVLGFSSGRIVALDWIGDAL